MNAFVLHEFDDRAAMVRWSASAAIIAALHAALIALGVAWYTRAPPPGVALPTIMIDLAPPSAPAAPSVQPLDLLPGPEMREADPPPPPPEPSKQEAIEEQLAPTPPQENPVVEAPPEQKVEPSPPKPEPAKIVPDQPKPIPVKPKPIPVKPKPLRTEVKKPVDTSPAPRTSAPPKAERRASLAPSSATAGATSAAALASYNQRVAAHLQRFKQYPSGARAAGEQGTSRLSFTLGRSGQVLGSRLAGSSGHPSLDGETLAMVRRAQPFPPMPPELQRASMSFSIPVQFSIR
ncbi:energy transducer TonB [Bradyrhizobium sp.]|jgi:protein TonB|uniref:energy transducer TonB n=1 Tax=Bradyrhizobium sp. TaxID=376 RepID=UPI002DF7C755|nr:energy transducer TonB [Bradyrhizobium sp.]